MNMYLKAVTFVTCNNDVTITDRLLNTCFQGKNYLLHTCIRDDILFFFETKVLLVYLYQ